jgi:hypothetical protein
VRELFVTSSKSIRAQVRSYMFGAGGSESRTKAIHELSGMSACISRSGSRAIGHPWPARDEVILTSVAFVDRALVDRQRRFVHGFGKRRVRVDDARQILG